MMAMAYGNVYVARVAFGAKDVQTVRAFMEAESYDGPSVIIAYRPASRHGFDLAYDLAQQNMAVDCGYWPLFRYDPRRRRAGENPLLLDSEPPRIALRDFHRQRGPFPYAGKNRSGPARAFSRNWPSRHVQTSFMPSTPSWRTANRRQRG